jgi:protein-disulfide isomerase
MRLRSRLWDVIDRASAVAVLVAALAILVVVVENRWSRSSRAPNSTTPSSRQGVVSVDGLEATLPLWLRDTDAQFALVEFSDFQCPFCRTFATTTYPQLKQEFLSGGRLVHVFRHLPIATTHPQAFKAALAAECARGFGRFAEIHDRFFSHQTNLSDSELFVHGSAVGIDSAALRKCIDARTTADAVEADMNEAFRLGVSATPTFFIGRIHSDRKKVSLIRRIDGAHPYPVVRNLIQEQLGLVPRG